MAKNINPGKNSVAVVEKPDSKLSSFHKQFADDPDDVVVTGSALTGFIRTPVRKSFFDMCNDHLLYHSRGKVVRDLSNIFDCSIPQVDKCIAEVHAEWKELAAETRATRMKKYLSRKDKLFSMAMNKGDERSANTIVETLAETMGDKKPDIHLMLGGDKTPEQLLTAADELRKLTEEAGEDE